MKKRTLLLFAVGIAIGLCLATGLWARKTIIILGSGDSRQKFQAFKLPKAPSGVSELQIYVNGRLWTRVDSFFGRRAEEQCYIVIEDGDGRAWVQFGDGEMGALLPSGSNVVAKYRHGAQLSAKSREHVFKVSSEFGDRDVLKFRVNGTGTISVKARWNGDARQLALILNGPSRVEFARKDGRSPLALTFIVTEQALQKGTDWRVSIVNFSSRGSAGGKIWISSPLFE